SQGRPRRRARPLGGALRHRPHRPSPRRRGWRGAGVQARAGALARAARRAPRAGGRPPDGRADRRCRAGARRRRSPAAQRCRLPRGRGIRSAARGQLERGPRAARPRERARGGRSDHAGVPAGARSRRAGRRARELMPRRIVVVGGGFAGLHLIRRLEPILRRGEAELTLLDRNNYHLFTPLLYQVATGELPPHAVAYPLRLPIAHAGQRFVQTEVEGVDLERRAVRTADGDFAYDHLVLVPGSVTNDYGIAGVAEHALQTKGLADGLTVRKRILETFEATSREPDLARRRELLTFVIIGAGPVGV